MQSWRVYCVDHKWPGLWRRCLRRQVVAIGWGPGYGYHLEGEKKRARGWTTTKNALGKMRPGDQIVVHLRGNRIGRVGEVVRMKVTDREWDPLIPKAPKRPYGEMGRLVHVRWFPIGPEDHDLVVQLPNKIMKGQRSTISRLSLKSLGAIKRLCEQRASWVPVSAGGFAHEKALADYIASYPHHLEDGLVPYPYKKVREAVLGNKSRTDVLLTDTQERPVVVECKQGSASVGNVRQLRGYMKRLRKESGRKRVRGILVHGGSRKLSKEVRKELRADRSLPVEAVRYALRVDFDPST